MTISGDQAYLADGYGGLRVIDISRPDRPQIAGAVSTLGWSAIDVVISGTYAFVAAGRNGLRAIDVSWPSDPREVNSLTMPRYAEDLAALEGLVFVADRDRDGGLRVVDARQPSALRELVTWSTPGDALAVSIANGNAYVASGFEGLVVVDVARPESPSANGGISTLSYARDVSVSERYAFVADDASGLLVIDLGSQGGATSVPTAQTTATPTPTLSRTATLPAPSQTRAVTASSTPDQIGTAVAGTLTARAPTPTRTRTATTTPLPTPSPLPSRSRTATATPDRIASAVALTLTAMATPPSSSSVFLPCLDRQRVINTPRPVSTSAPSPSKVPTAAPRPSATPVLCALVEAEPNDLPAQALGHPVLCEGRVIDGEIGAGGALDSADYYTLSVDSTLRVKVSMNTITLRGATELDLGLWTCDTEGCTQRGWSGQRGSAPEAVDVLLDAGTYFVGAHPQGSPGGRASYLLEWSVVP